MNSFIFQTEPILGHHVDLSHNLGANPSIRTWSNCYIPCGDDGIFCTNWRQTDDLSVHSPQGVCSRTQSLRHFPILIRKAPYVSFDAGIRQRPLRLEAIVQYTACLHAKHTSGTKGFFWLRSVSQGRESSIKKLQWLSTQLKYRTQARDMKRQNLVQTKTKVICEWPGVRFVSEDRTGADSSMGKCSCDLIVQETENTQWCLGLLN